MIKEVDGTHVLFLVFLFSGKLSSWKPYWSFMHTRLVDLPIFMKRNIGIRFILKTIMM